MKTFKDLYEDVRKMPDGGYGVFADVFKDGKRGESSNLGRQI